MAYQTQRDPLLDHQMQMAIQKKGRELLGLVLIVLGLAALAIVLSYAPDDPSWLTASDEPVQNWLGRAGASTASLFFTVIGWGAATLPVILIAWGIRLVVHLGVDRLLSRFIFVPLTLALGSIYAAGLGPGNEWATVHSFGLGGLLGDMLFGIILTVLPFGTVFAVKLTTFLIAICLVAALLIAMGFTRSELSRCKAFLKDGVYTLLAMTFGMAYYLRDLRDSGQAQTGLSEHMAAQERRDPFVKRADPAPEPAAEPYAAPQMHAPLIAEPKPVALAEDKPGKSGGLLGRLPPLMGRAARKEAVELPPLHDGAFPEAAEVNAEAPDEDRIHAKISHAIKARVGMSPPLPKAMPGDELTTPRNEQPSLSSERADPFMGRRGPTPLIADPAPRDQEPLLRGEPPLSAGGAIPKLPPINVPPLTAPNVTPEDEIEPASAQLPPAALAAPKAESHERHSIVDQHSRKPIKESAQAKAEAQPKLSFEETHPGFELPPLNLLEDASSIQRQFLSDEALAENARMLESVLDDYGVKGEIVSVRPGPVVTMYELEPAPGLKASRVIGLADDIARSMAALSARVSTVPGRSVIGIELPNDTREKVLLREILASRDFGDSNMKLPLALGKDIGGDAVVANLAKMPHLLIAGTTGSGKSVAINTMILSLLYKLTPQECRLIMIDPKMLELSVYDGIPHLLSPVVTDPKKAVVALKWVVGEMEERYRKMSKMGVRNIDGYNGRVSDALAKDELFSRTVQTGFDDNTGEPVFETEEFAPEPLPYIVVIVDEMADLMMVAGKEIEACIQRLAQMARASGIHLIMATQRPSVDVITGTIKANFPTRISFQVTSKIDSRTILGEMGAEQLLGMGDMLYMGNGSKISRCHGPFVSDEEVEEIVNHLKAFGAPEYVSGVVDGPDETKADGIDAVLGLGGNTDGEDALYDQAVAIVLKDRKCSTSYIQRKLAIGYNKAARLVEQMEDEGVVSASNHVGKREILVPEQ